MRLPRTPLPTFRFDPVQRGKLTSGSQEHGIKDLFPGMLWKAASFWQSLHLAEKSNTLSR